MRMQQVGFANNDSQVQWYDLQEDWSLIESSLAMQYGIRIRNEADMPFDEFCTLVAGIMPDTPLGQIVSIRAEKNPETIRGFSADQKRIHSEWGQRQAEKMLNNPEDLDKQMKALTAMITATFGEGVIK